MPSLRRFTSSAGVVRASSSIRSDCRARLVQTFWPLTTYWLPSRSALVFSWVVSEPVVGSVTPKACMRSSPLAMPGRYSASARRCRAAAACPSCTSGHGRRRRCSRWRGSSPGSRRRPNRQPGAAVFLRDQRGEEPRLGQRVDEGVRVLGRRVQLRPVRIVEGLADLATPSRMSSTDRRAASRGRRRRHDAGLEIPPRLSGHR